MITTEFGDEVMIEGYFILLPDLESYEKILEISGNYLIRRRVSMGEVIKVGMADLNICKAPDTITTLGLGSCIGIALLDPVTKIGGLAHIMLPDSTKMKNNSNIAKFADTGIVELVRRMTEAGGGKEQACSKDCRRSQNVRGKW